MNDLVVVGIAGFAAAFVDGALGMGFGPTSSSILLSSGVSPDGRVGDGQHRQGRDRTSSAARRTGGSATSTAGSSRGSRFPAWSARSSGTVILTNVDGDRCDRSSPRCCW